MGQSAGIFLQKMLEGIGVCGVLGVLERESQVYGVWVTERIFRGLFSLCSYQN
jgi:hypothetical protein